MLTAGEIVIAAPESVERMLRMVKVNGEETKFAVVWAARF